MLSIEIPKLRSILTTHVPDFADRIILDLLQTHADVSPPADPPPREMTLEEEIARMVNEGCPNSD